ncbi:MAG: sigma-70 family RNA polymerase sigma factor [Gammaproteobacteria bacterium]|nr:sigma-70 family RNA polymerase sigma factor [Gammaproteobacteria bacterium]
MEQHSPTDNRSHPANTWLDEHGDVLYRFALLRLGNPHLAEEAVQETLVAALQGWSKFSGRASVRTWLTGILKNKIIDHFRRSQREVPLPDDWYDNDPFSDHFVDEGHWSFTLKDWGKPESMLEQGEFWRVLQECLDKIPPRLRHAFLMREVMEEKSEKVCQDLDISPTNLWTMLYRARMGLRKCFEKTGVKPS